MTDKLLIVFLQAFLPRITPAIKDMLKVLLRKAREKIGEEAVAFYHRAKKTPNRLDDEVAAAVLFLLDIPEPEESPEQDIQQLPRANLVSEADGG